MIGEAASLCLPNPLAARNPEISVFFVCLRERGEIVVVGVIGITLDLPITTFSAVVRGMVGWIFKVAQEPSDHGLDTFIPIEVPEIRDIGD